MMKLLIIYLFACFMSSALSLHPYWRLAWSDEFNTLDTTKWNLRNMPGNWGNKELQWYHPNQVSVANGSLVITAIKQAFGGEQYMSGRIDTQDKAVFTYGRYEVRAKMAAGKGTWPAMWLLSQDKCWGSGAEVDIAEFRGSYPTQIGTYYHYASTCCTGFPNCISSKGSAHTVPADLTADYHTYALEWWPTNMTWFVDDKVVDSYQTPSLTVTKQDASPHYWVINNAIGGSYPGNPDSTTVFPLSHSVDYVRNYVWRASCSGVTCGGRGCCNPTTFLCQCNAGFAGANCEYNLGTATKTFDSVTSLDNIPNGWGNSYTTYITANTVSSNGVFFFTLTNSSCPANCGGTAYSSGAWESIPRYSYGSFVFRAKASSVPGTSFSLTAAGETTVLEQVAFTFLGSNRSFVQLWTWTNSWGYKHADIALGFDASMATHTYSFTFAVDSITWFVDGIQVYQSKIVIPTALRLGPGAYYTAQPEWYGPVSYKAPSTTYLDNFQWTITAKTAKC